MDSDSDWDSLPGDPEPPSIHESSQIIPKPPASKNKSPRHNARHGNTSPLPKSVKQPSKASSTSAEPTAVHKPNKMYGRDGGVTAFVDHSGGDKRTGVETVDSGKSSNKADTGLELKDVNSNPVNGRRRSVQGNDDFHKGSKPSGQANEGFHKADEPPFTNFKDALPANDVKDSSRQEQNKSNIKSAYRAETPESANDPPLVSILRKLPDIPDCDENDFEDGKGGNDKLVNGQGQIVEFNNAACCGPYKDSTGYTYIFNHGKSHYLSVVPEWNEPQMKSLGERSEKWQTCFWQEFFGLIAILVDFGIIFLLELIKFTFRKILVRVLVGFIVVFGDHLLKPVLAATFNSLLQPTFTFLWNALLGVKNGFKPLLDITREIIFQIATLLKGFRLFELNWKPTFTNTVDSQHRQQIQEI